MNLIARYKTKTPKIWRKITIASISIKATCVALLGASYAVPLPEGLTTAAGWALGVCVFITAISESHGPKTEKITTKSDCNCVGDCTCDNEPKKL